MGAVRPRADGQDRVNRRRWGTVLGNTAPGCKRTLGGLTQGDHAVQAARRRAPRKGWASPRPMREKGRMTHLPDDLASLTVLDLDGRSLPLGELWRDRTAVVVFLRHYG